MYTNKQTIQQHKTSSDNTAKMSNRIKTSYIDMEVQFALYDLYEIN